MAQAIFPLTADHHAAVHALNQRFATELSSETPQSLASLIARSVYARGIGGPDAFLMAFDQASQVDGWNLTWFKERYPHFLYIDRVAVAPEAQGGGHARRLYADLEQWARARGYPMLACEVNVRPPNGRSDAFHAALGFAEVAQRELPNGKRVRYLVRPLGS